MPARLRLALLLLLLAATVGFGVWRVTRPPVVERFQRPASSDASVLEDRRVRLKPDRRALIALADLDRLLTGADRDSVHVQWQSDHWEVRYRGEHAAALPEYANYDALRAMLVEWIEHRHSAGHDSLFRLNAAGPEPPSTVLAPIQSELAKWHALGALEHIDNAWSSGHAGPRLASLASQALTQLVLETEDRVGASDSLAGRAWAAVVLASLTNSAAVPRDESLLADALGYSAVACRLANRLPESDAARHFVLREDETLGRQAVASAPVGTRYLYLVRLARRGDLEAWGPRAEHELERDPAMALPLLSSGLALQRFESRLPAGVMMLGAALASLPQNEGRAAVHAQAPDGREFGALLGQFEAALQGMPPEADGPVLDRALMNSYYRSSVYSGALGIADHLMYALASPRDAADFAAAFDPEALGAAGEFSRWLEHMTSRAPGDSITGLLMHDLGALRSFGEPLLWRTYDRLNDIARQSPRALSVFPARRLATQLDARPVHRDHYAEMIRESSFDVGRAEIIKRSLVDCVHPLDAPWQIRWAGYNDNAAVLIQLSANRAFPVSERAMALRALRMVATSDSVAVEQAHRALLAEHPGDFEAAEGLAEYFARHGRNAEGRDVMTAWLARPGRSDRALEAVVARTRIARFMQKDHLTEQALPIAQRAAESWQFGAMQRTALILAELGRIGEAKEMALRAWKRYPDSDAARALVIRVLWQNGEYQLASRVVVEAPGRISNDTWQADLAPFFKEHIAPDPKLVARAIGPIAEAGYPASSGLRSLSYAVSEAGDPQTAYAVESAVRATGQDALVVLLGRYRYMERWKGGAAAVDWIKAQVAPLDAKSCELFLNFCYGEGQDDLLWALPLPDIDPEGIEFLWLLRAAGSLRAPVAVAERQRELRKHFGATSSSHYRLLGRVVLGMEPETKALEACTTPRASSEAFYYLGLKAQWTGRVAEAAEWYSRCLELNQRMNGEDYWAREQLIRWYNTGSCLDTIARDQDAKQRAAATQALAARSTSVPS